MELDPVTREGASLTRPHALRLRRLGLDPGYMRLSFDPLLGAAENASCDAARRAPAIPAFTGVSVRDRVGIPPG